MTWQWRPFENQGRKDGLKLKHWAKCLKDPTGKVKLADPGDYQYAKYNKKVLFFCSFLPRRACIVRLLSQLAHSFGSAIGSCHNSGLLKGWNMALMS